MSFWKKAAKDLVKTGIGAAEGFAMGGPAGAAAGAAEGLGGALAGNLKDKVMPKKAPAAKPAASPSPASYKPNPDRSPMYSGPSIGSAAPLIQTTPSSPADYQSMKAQRIKRLYPGINPSED